MKFKIPTLKPLPRVLVERRQNSRKRREALLRSEMARVNSLKPFSTRPHKPVLCISTGEVLPSVEDAALSVEVCGSAITNAIRSGRATGKNVRMRFRYATREEIAAAKEGQKQ